MKLYKTITKRIFWQVVEQHRTADFSADHSGIFWHTVRLFWYNIQACCRNFQNTSKMYISFIQWRKVQNLKIDKTHTSKIVTDYQALIFCF